MLAVDGTEVLDARGLNFRLAIGEVGEDAELEVWRSGERMTVRLALETPPYDPPPQITTLTGRHALSGATVANMSPGLNEELGFDLFKRGVVVIGDPARQRCGAASLPARRHHHAAGGRADRRASSGWTPSCASASLPWQLEVERGGRTLAVVIN